MVLTPIVQCCRLARLFGKAPKDTELGQTGFFRPNVGHRMGKEQTGDPLDLRTNTGFVLVANHRIAFPMPEVPTAVHVFGPLPNGHSVGDFHGPAFSAQHSLCGRWVNLCIRRSSSTWRALDVPFVLQTQQRRLDEEHHRLVAQRKYVDNSRTNCYTLHKIFVTFVFLILWPYFSKL